MKNRIKTRNRTKIFIRKRSESDSNQIFIDFEKTVERLIENGGKKNLKDDSEGTQNDIAESEGKSKVFSFKFLSKIS